MNSLTTCLLLAGGLQLGARAFSTTTESCPYTVEIDDSCYFIAKNRFDVAPAELSRLNGGKFDTACDIFPGQEIRVPCRAQQTVSQTDVSGKCLVEHKIEAGETCSSISLRYNIAVHVLQAYNKLDRSCSIQANQKICVSTSKSPVTCTKKHSVVPGDNCYDLARKNGANLIDLKTWNPDLINNRCAIRPGHDICVAAAAAEPVTTSTSAVASPTTVRISVVSQSKVGTSGAVVPTAAPATHGDAVSTWKLSSEARAQIKLYVRSFVGNRTATLLDGGDDKVLLPSQTQLDIALKALASVSIHNGVAVASAEVNGTVAPGVSVSASASVAVHILASAKLDFDHRSCAVGACTVGVVSSSRVNAAANAAVSKPAGSKGDTAVQSKAQAANRITAEAKAEVDADSC